MITNRIPVSITPKAVTQIKAIMQAKAIIPEAYGLRVGVRGGGCGTTFLLGFDKATPTDEMYAMGDVKVIVDKKHMLYVAGMEIDYEETAEGGGFVFNNPAANPEKTG